MSDRRTPIHGNIDNSVRGSNNNVVIRNGMRFENGVYGNNNVLNNVRFGASPPALVVEGAKSITVGSTETPLEPGRYRVTVQEETTGKFIEFWSLGCDHFSVHGDSVSITNGVGDVKVEAQGNSVSITNGTGDVTVQVQGIVDHLNAQAQTGDVNVLGVGASTANIGSRTGRTHVQ